LMPALLRTERYSIRSRSGVQGRGEGLDIRLHISYLGLIYKLYSNSASSQDRGAGRKNGEWRRQASAGPDGASAAKTSRSSGGAGRWKGNGNRSGSGIVFVATRRPNLPSEVSGDDKDAFRPSSRGRRTLPARLAFHAKSLMDLRGFSNQSRWVSGRRRRNSLQELPDSMGPIRRRPTDLSSAASFASAAERRPLLTGRKHRRRRLSEGRPEAAMDEGQSRRAGL
jgi:hypothetical protein